MGSTNPIRLAMSSTIVTALVVAGCNEHPIKPVELQVTGVGDSIIEINPYRDVDILFVIDNSGSMGEEQATLAANFEAFIDVLEAEDVDANYRIGITTTDNGHAICQGTGPEGGQFVLSSCRSRLSQFVFNPGGAAEVDRSVEACESLCPEALADLTTEPSAIDDEADGLAPRPWLERIEGGTNLPEGVTTTEAFACLGPQGIDGCGFESPLEAMYKALRRASKQDEDAWGFMRDDALLAVVFITDEADCSVQGDGWRAFDPAGDRTLWSDESLAYPTSAVCWNAGVACERDADGRLSCAPADIDVAGNITDDPSAAVLQPVSRYVDLLEGILEQKRRHRSDAEVLVSLIGGVSQGYPDPIVEYGEVGDAAFVTDYGSAPGCSSDDGVAVPPVRLRALAEHFAPEDDAAMMFSVCDADYRPALDAIADRIRRELGPTCVDICPADDDPTTPGLQPQCILTEVAPDGTDTAVPLCDVVDGHSALPAGAATCARPLVGVQRDPACGLSPVEIDVLRARDVERTPGAVLRATCTVSQTPGVDCPG